MRIDDETLGIPLVSTAPGAFAGELINPRGCYICKNDYTLVDAFYHYLCPSCAALSHAKRGQGTDLTGRRALLTGGRAKIGMYIALRLLRDGAHTTITTRFPHDAVRRFSALEDSADWIDRLKIVGIDLRDPTQVIVARRRGRGRRPARHPDQQRLPDGAPYAGLLRAAGRGRAGAAADRHRAARDRQLRPDQRRPPGRDRRHPAAARGRPPRDARRHTPGLDHRARAQGRQRQPRGPPGRHRRRRRRAAARPADRPTPGPRPSTRSTRWSCSRCSSATRPRRSC